MNNVIKTDMLTQAFELYEEKLAFSYASGESFNTSSNFDKRIKKMIKSQTNVFHRVTLTKARRVVLVAAILAAMLAASLSVEAIREKIFSFFITSGQQVDVVEYDNSSTAFSEFKACKPSYITEGYILSDSGSDDSSAYFYYTKGGNYLSIEQFKSDEYKSAVDAEFKTSTEENIDGVNYIVKTSDDGMTMLIFNKYECVFEIVGFESKDELLKVAKGVEQ